MTWYILGNLDTTGGFYIGSPNFESEAELVEWYNNDIIKRVDTVEITCATNDRFIYVPLKEFLRKYKLKQL